MQSVPRVSKTVEGGALHSGCPQVRLTPAHDQRGAARCGELTRPTLAVPAWNHRSAAPRLVHALVRQHEREAWTPLYESDPKLSLAHHLCRSD